MFDLRLKHPSNIVICGPSGSGKTNIILNLLRARNELFDVPPSQVLFFYSEYQESYKTMRDEKLVNVFIKGIPDLEDIKRMLSPKKSLNGSICIFDDLLSSTSSITSEMFTVIGHHLKSTNIFTTQSLFYSSKEYRTMMLNAHYMFLCKSPRDSSQIINLAKQMFPYNTKFLTQVFQKATSKPYSYLLLDFHQSQHEYLRVRANIFAHERPMSVYFLR